MRTIVRRNSIRQRDDTPAVAHPLPQQLAVNGMRSFAVTHARRRDRHAAGGVECAPRAPGIASLRSPESRDATLVGLEIPAAVRISPTALSGTSIMHCLREHAAESPDDTAFVHLIDGDTPQASMTYAQLDRRARAIAAYLQDARLAGKNVVLAYPAGLEFIAAFFGALYAGCVAAPAHPPRTRTLDRFHALTGDAGASVVLSTAATVAHVKTMKGASAGIRWIATDKLTDANADCWTEYDPDPDSLAMLQYTSGSTSRPKGVMLSHANLLANTRAICRAFKVGRDTKAVFWLPACHDMGLIGGVLAPAYYGIPNVIIAPAVFVQNPFLWLDTISRTRATISGGPNFAYDLCVRKIKAEQRAVLDLSSWSVAFIGAETVDPATLARFAEAFAPCGFRPTSFYPCYGLAEATLMVTGPTSGNGATVRAFRDDALAHHIVVPLTDDAPGARHLVGCGAPVGSLRVAIVAPETHERAGADRVGEVWVAGDSIGKGYWRNPGRTAATFHARLRDAADDPYLRTGDLGFLYEQQLYITGRIDDLIIVRGLNHHPQDIEATARQSHPRLEAGLGAAFAFEEHGVQRLVLVHEVVRDGRVDLALVIGGLCTAVLEEHGLALDGVVLIRCGTMARTSSGKVQRRATCAAFCGGTLKYLARYRAPSWVESAVLVPPAIRPANSTALAAVCQHALAMSGIGLADVTPETPIATLGLDSLQHVELVAALDKSFGRHLPDTIYGQATTLGELAAAVQKHLIDCPHAEVSAGAVAAENYDLALFPEYLEFKRHKRMLLAVTEANPYFQVDHGDDTPTQAAPGLARIATRAMTNFCAYDYVGMAHDREVTAATKAAIDRYGTGAGASRLVSGEKQIHLDLEHALAAFLGAPAAIVFVSGHATNVTTIGHLMRPGDLIVHDILSHNSILQGARLSGATCRGFAHNDWRALDALLSGIRHSFRRVLIAIEGVYSMDGDYPDLARFVDIKERHRAMLYVDEAHSLGTMGKTGRGLGEHAEIAASSVDLWMGTLSKSLASCGGYIAGSAELIEYLKYTTPGFVYSVGISPPNAATALAALTVLDREPQRVVRLHELSALFLRLARERGLNTGHAAGTPVIPIIVGNSVRCLLLSRALCRRGINVQPIIHPAVPEHATRLRVFITTNHTESLVRGAVDAIAEELSKL
jgi:8-amino-7-oxononanoate synthase